MTATETTAVTPDERLEALFEELAELAGQRNAIDGRIVDLVAEIDGDQLWGASGARSVAALVAWKTGCSPGNAATIATIAGRAESFPRCVAGLREGRLSLDQVGVIAARAGQGSDEHYAELAAVATVSQLRTAVKLEPRPEADPRPGTQPGITATSDESFAYWRITLAHPESAQLEAALHSHLEALISDWRSDREESAQPAGAESDHDAAPGGRPPMPTTLDAFLRLIQTGWDTEAHRRPHGQHTTVVVHLDIDRQIGALHRGPLLAEADRQYLTCDATCEVWFERHGQPIGAGRSTRTISRRLRRALEHRHPTCAVPGCGATRGLHAHHIRHWENGGETELSNLVLPAPITTGSITAAPSPSPAPPNVSSSPTATAGH